MGQCALIQATVAAAVALDLRMSVEAGEGGGESGVSWFPAANESVGRRRCTAQAAVIKPRSDHSVDLRLQTTLPHLTPAPGSE